MEENAGKCAGRESITAAVRSRSGHSSLHWHYELSFVGCFITVTLTRQGLHFTSLSTATATCALLHTKPACARNVHSIFPLQFYHSYFTYESQSASLQLVSRSPTLWKYFLIHNWLLTLKYQQLLSCGIPQFLQECGLFIYSVSLKYPWQTTTAWIQFWNCISPRFTNCQPFTEHHF